MGGSVQLVHWHKGLSVGLGDRLRRTAGVSVVFAKIVEGNLDFFLSYFIALVESVNGVSLGKMACRLFTLSWHIWCTVCHARHRRVSSLSASAATFALSASWLSMMLGGTLRCYGLQKMSGWLQARRIWLAWKALRG